MHGLLLALALGSAIGLRMLCILNPGSGWNQRWIQAMFLFVLPPLLLLTSAIALVCMGPHGMGISALEGWGSYGSAVMFLGIAGTIAICQGIQARQELARLKQYPLCCLRETRTIVRILPIELPFVAQVGLWKPEIVISQGILETLNLEQLQAVLAHEQAHATHHDTFWFFSLGGLRRLTNWLPNSDRLWQELLLLRELRADRIAAQTTDSLALAEALVVLVRSPMVQTDWSAAFYPQMLTDRFSERIDAILEAEPLRPIPGWLMAAIVIMGLIPLAIVPFHHG